MNNKNYFWGFFFIIIGILLFIARLFNIQLFHTEKLWPIFVLIPGLCFNLLYFSTRKSPGVLVPGGILITLGLLFFFETLTNWHFAEYTWPIYPLSVAIGLLQLYIFGTRKRELLIPIGILSLVAAIAFACMIYGNIFRWINSSLVVPAILVLIGVALIFGKEHKTIE